MKASTFVVGILLVGGIFTTGAQAQNYPWCAHYGGGGFGGGAQNCGFTTFQQCQEDISGMGGFCERNTQFVPPPGPHGRYR
jgi:Protein of unknown function (DUF3551)